MNQYYYRFFGSKYLNNKPEMVYCTGKHLDQRNGRDYFCTGTKVYEADDDWYSGLSISAVKNAIVMLGYKWTDKIKDGDEQIVYEGDLIPHIIDEKIIGIVKFGHYEDQTDLSNFGFYVDWGEKSTTRVDLGFWLKQSKIIGNVHENGDLLKQK